MGVNLMFRQSPRLQAWLPRTGMHFRVVFRMARPAERALDSPRCKHPQATGSSYWSPRLAGLAASEATFSHGHHEEPPPPAFRGCAVVA